mgnify:CR=1 FL=1
MKKGWICLLFAAFLLSSVAVVGQKWQQVGVLEADVFIDETVILVNDPGAIVLDRPMLIERRDGKLRDTYEVQHVYGHQVILKERLRHEFVEGSRLFQ